MAIRLFMKMSIWNTCEHMEYCWNSKSNDRALFYQVLTSKPTHRKMAKIVHSPYRYSSLCLHLSRMIFINFYEIFLKNLSKVTSKIFKEFSKISNILLALPSKYSLLLLNKAITVHSEVLCGPLRSFAVLCGV